MFWAAERAAYDPETLSIAPHLLERAVAALPHQDRTEERMGPRGSAPGSEGPGGLLT